MNESITFNKSISLNQFYAKTYLKMALGLFISAGVGFLLAHTMPLQILSIYNNPFLAIILAVVQIVIALAVGKRAYSGNSTSAMVWFVVYSVINALTFTVVFAAFDPNAIIIAFGTTGLTFLVMSLYGRFTKRRLTAMSNCLFGLLIGVVITSLINLFLHSTALVWLVSLVSIAIFALYMALDTQMMTEQYQMASDDSELSGLSTYWAMQLYMDIVNMFIQILQILSVLQSDD